MDEFLAQFGNREIATLIWVGGLVTLMMFKSNLRKAMGGVLKAFFQWPLLRVFIAAMAYIALMVWLLHWRDIWMVDNLKSTIAWTLTFAFVAMFEANRISDDERYFTKILRDLIGFTAVFIFIIELHSFSLLTELIAFPLITFLVLMHEFSKSKDEHAQVEKLLGWVVAIIGLAYLGVSIWKTVENFQSLATLDTLREFLMPIFLSILFLPFLFGLGLYMVYESTFVSMGIWMEDKKLLRFAKRRALLSCRSDFDYLKRWSRHFQRERPESKKGVNETLRHVRSILNREKNPTAVSMEDGWVPWVAKDFMTDFELKTRDYHEGFEGDWFAESNMNQVGRGWPQNNIAYYVEGTAECAKQLKLKLNISDPEKDTEARALLSDAILSLIEKACDEPLSSALAKQVERLDDFDKKHAQHKLTLKKDDWSRGTRPEYDLIFSIGVVE